MRTMQGHFTVIITVGKVVKMLTETEPKQSFSCCQKEVKDETVWMATVRMAGGRLEG